jgi:hypothetical protein
MIGNIHIDALHHGGKLFRRFFSGLLKMKKNLSILTRNGKKQHSALFRNS